MNGIILLSAITAVAVVFSRYRREQKHWALRQQLRVLSTQDRQLF